MIATRSRFSSSKVS